MRNAERTIITREEIFRKGENISRKLKTINSLEKRLKNKNLFKDQKEEIQKKLQEVRKGL